MTPEEQLQLRRKTWEALGWVIVCDKRSRYPWKRIDPDGNAVYGFQTWESCVDGLGAIESDDGIALAELRKWCRTRDWRWRIADAPHRGGIFVEIWTDKAEAIYADANNPAEAICRALIGAVKKRQKHMPKGKER